MQRFLTVSAVCGALFIGLGCSGWFSQPVIHGVVVQPDSCGNYVAAMDVEAAGRALTLSVDGDEVERFRVDGRQVIRWLGSGLPGSTHSVEVSFSRRVVQTASVTVPAPSDAVTLTAGADRLFAGNNETVELSVSDVCAAEVSPRWSVSVDGGAASTGTMLPSSRTARVSVPNTVLPGRHQVFATVDLSPFVQESDALVVFIEPHCADTDGDGITTCAGDCDDGDNTRGFCDPSDDLDADGFPSLSAGGTDCNDANSSVHPGAVDAMDADGDGYALRDGLDQDCNGTIDDGITLVDCDDTNPRVHPGATELGVPNGIDENCDGRIDEGTVAYDDDGDGLSEQDGDCNDADDTVYPGAAELPDCHDQDCDGDVDEGLEVVRLDDTYESNDTVGTATDLHTTGRNKFSQQLDLITRDTQDEEWFTFWSSDGLFDSWGITARIVDGADGGIYEVSIGTQAGRVLSSQRLRAGQAVSLGGSGMKSDSGTYTVRLRALHVPRDYCPVRLGIASR